MDLIKMNRVYKLLKTGPLFRLNQKGALLFLGIIFLFWLHLFVGCQSESFSPSGLRTDLLRNVDQVGLKGKKQPVLLHDSLLQKDTYEIAKIKSSHPLFHWQLDTKSLSSTAFQILVSKELKTLANNTGEVWDTGKVNHSTFFTVYEGLPLEENKVYYWKVRYWNEKSRPSSYSLPQAFVLDKNRTNDQFSQEPIRAIEQSPSITPKEGGYFIDFKKAAFGKLKVQLTAEKEGIIQLSVGEMKDAKAPKVADLGGNIRYYNTQINLKPGTHWYDVEWPENKKRASNSFMVKMPAYIGEVFPFRYVEIQNYTGALQEEQVVRTMAQYTFDDEASYFDSSNTVLNQVWDLCKYSMKATSFLGYYVDGDRERIPYEADAYINQLSHYAVDAEYSISRASMKHLLFNPTWPTEWTLYTILMAWYDYLYTGDNRFISLYYDELKVKTLMDLSDGTGLISTLTGKQTPDFFKRLHKQHWGKNNNLRDIVDWPQAIPPGGFENLAYYIGSEKEYPGENDGYVYEKYNAVVNALYYGALQRMEKIALHLDKTEDLALYQSQAEKVRKQFLMTFQDPSNGLINDGEETNHKSQHANMFALTFGLVPEKDKKAVVEYIKSKNMSCSVYASQVLLEGLFEFGGDQHALDLMAATTERSWYNMIRFGSTITMEAWDKRYKPNLDLNHAWGGAPANIIVRKMMGVEPLTPGGQSIKIHPKIGQLEYASLKTSLITGVVEVECRQTENSYILTVSIPGGVKGDLRIPSTKGNQRLYINGELTSDKDENGEFHLIDFPAGTAVLEVK